STVDGAVSSLKDQATKAKTTVSSGLNTVVTPTTNSDGSTNYKVETAKDLAADSVTSTDNSSTGATTTVLNKNGVVATSSGDSNTLTSTGNTIASGNGSNTLTSSSSTITDGLSNTTTVGTDKVTIANTNTNTNTNNSITSDGSTLTNTTSNLTAKYQTKGIELQDTSQASNNIVQGTANTATGFAAIKQSGDNAEIATLKSDALTIISGNNKTNNVTGKTTLNSTGLTIQDGPSVTTTGIDAANKLVTNVAAGVADTDAVNVGQLTKSSSTVGNSTASALGGGSTYDPTTGTVSAPTYSVNGSSKNNVGDAISALDQGFTVTSNGANGKAIKAGDTLEIGTADGEKNLTVSKDGNTIKYGLNRNLDLDSVKAGNTTLNNAGVAVDDGTGNVSKLTTAG
ncbi:Coiled stalk of trimeric autotransporter adhesin, partial [Acinetobacter boissieri]